MALDLNREKNEIYQGISSYFGNILMTKGKIICGHGVNKKFM